MKHEMNCMKAVHPYKITGIAKEKKIEREDLRVVNIFGTAPSGLTVPPYGEIWCINNSWSYGHKPDKLFALDGWKCMLADCDRSHIPREMFYDFLREGIKNGMEIYNAYPENLRAQETGEIIADCLVFPKDVTCSLVPGTYFTSSIAHILAFAAAQEELGYKKIDTINLHGIEIWGSFDGDEYHYQTPCVDFWMAFCAGRGINIMIPSYLLQMSKSSNNLYGYFNER